MSRPVSPLYLSKSLILAGIQCPRRLYLEVHHPERAQEDTGRGLNASMGNQAGEAARGLFPGGRMIPYNDDLFLPLMETRYHIVHSSHVPLFEATFEHKGVLVRTDIVTREGEGLRLIEVKSSTSVKDHHLLDCGIQSWVVQGAGYPVERVELACLNSDFVYQGNGDLRDLFLYEDVTDTIIPIYERIPVWVGHFQTILNRDLPKVAVGRQCTTPYLCPFRAFCMPEMPEYPVTSLPRGGSIVFELLSEGIRDIRDIPEGRLIKGIHERVRRITASGIPELDPGAGNFLRKLPYPRYYLDFETIGFAVPRWEGTRPHQQVPFQWSCHIEERPGHLRHAEFLDISGNAPMDTFARKLLAALDTSGPIFVYNKRFEKGILEALSLALPGYAVRLRHIIDRMVDLLPLARRYYYHPEMKGSWSLKSVLPTIDPTLDYRNLTEIRDGMTAQEACLEAMDPATPACRRSELVERMREYCATDTLALVVIARFFGEGKQAA